MTALGDHGRSDTHILPVPGGQDLLGTHGHSAPGDHHSGDLQRRPVPGDHHDGDNQGASVPGDQIRADTQIPYVPGDHRDGDTHTPTVPGDVIPYEMLAFHAAILDEAEHARIAAENRLRAMLDPELRSGAKGLDPRLPEVAVVREVVERCRAFEHQAELELTRSLRRHPLGGWAKRTVGVGPKQGARLLAAIGNPAWNDAAGRPRRGPAELWAYCGLHVVPAQVESDIQMSGGGNDHPGNHGRRDTHGGPVPGVAPQRRRGQKANWNSVARSRAFLVAEKCIQNTGEPDSLGRPRSRSPYRDVYEAGRVKYADAVHVGPCPQCGGKGDPLPVGSPLKLGHQHMRALRLVAKAVLKDLWREARSLS